MVLRAGTTAEISPVADPAEERSPHAGERRNLASPSRLMGPSCMTTQRVAGELPDRVSKTIAEAKAGELSDASTLLNGGCSLAGAPLET